METASLNYFAMMSRVTFAESFSLSSPLPPTYRQVLFFDSEHVPFPTVSADVQSTVRTLRRQYAHANKRPARCTLYSSGNAHTNIITQMSMSKSTVHMHGWCARHVRPPCPHYTRITRHARSPPCPPSTSRHASPVTGVASKMSVHSAVSFHSSPVSPLNSGSTT